MNEVLEQLKQNLKHHGQSLTQVRKSVFLALLDQPPQTVTQLIARVGDKADRASIYRTVQLFEDLGIIERLQIGWKYKLELSHAYSGHHHHLTCLNCHKIIEFHENQSIEQELEKLAAEHGFHPTSHQLELRGYCPDCKPLFA